MWLLILAALVNAPSVTSLALPSTSFSRRTVLETLTTGTGTAALGIGLPSRANAATAPAAVGRAGGATVLLAAQTVGKSSAEQAFPLASLGLQVSSRGSRRCY